jgi:UDP-GlcNAc3NAcA epimerase
LLKSRPDWLLVYGDTNTTLAGALAAVKLHIPVAHVEAGLRSFNRRMPEEINRILTDHVSDVLFAPTSAAIENLQREGITDGRLCHVGDVMYDAALYYGERARQRSQILKHLGLPIGGYVLATVHRAENTDEPVRLRTICAALGQVARCFPVVFPLHPRTRKVLQRHELESELGGVLLTDPVGYLDMVMLEKNARVIATDSGGVQKEAFFHRVPCVTLRTETEWVELVDMGWNRLAPPTDVRHVALALQMASSPDGVVLSPYGEGDSAQRIVGVLLSRSQY